MRSTRTVECFDCGYEWGAVVYYCSQSGTTDIVKKNDQQCHECDSESIAITGYE